MMDGRLYLWDSAVMFLALGINKCISKCSVNIVITLWINNTHNIFEKIRVQESLSGMSVELTCRDYNYNHNNND